MIFLLITPRKILLHQPNESHYCCKEQLTHLSQLLMFTVVAFPPPQLIKLCNNQVQVKRHISRLPKESVNDL